MFQTVPLRVPVLMIHALKNVPLGLGRRKATEPGLGSRDRADPKQGKAANMSVGEHRRRVADPAPLVKGGSRKAYPAKCRKAATTSS
jgi:hypothetical protein